MNDLFRRVTSAANPRAVLWQDEFGQWQPISSDQIYQRVRALAKAFLDWGAKKGDRIALIAENRWEWAVTDFATLAIGAADVPIYPTLTGEQIAALIADAGCRIAVVSTRQQYDKLNSVRSLTQLEHIVIMDSPAPDGAIAFASLMDDADDRGSERDPVFDALARSVQPEDLATLIYTSGTTGEPKGVSLTHGNFAVKPERCCPRFRISIPPTPASPSFPSRTLPPAPSITSCTTTARRSSTARSSTSSRRPCAKSAPPSSSVFPASSRKSARPSSKSPPPRPSRKRLLAWALQSARIFTTSSTTAAALPLFCGRWPTSSSTPRCRRHSAAASKVFVSGGAPLGIDTAKWFAAAGIAALGGLRPHRNLACHRPQHAHQAPHGRCRLPACPMSNSNSPTMANCSSAAHPSSPATGKSPKPTASVSTPKDGSRTGDIGHFDADGFLYITDRKKELLKTSGGKMVAPQPIENKLKNTVLVAQAALVGDKHKFISALISPNFVALEDWAKHHGVHAQSRAELVADPRTIALYGEIVREVNGALANFETLKRFRVVAEEWTQESGELTPSMKLKRRVITQQYAAVIDELYADEATARGE